MISAVAYGASVVSGSHPPGSGQYQMSFVFNGCAGDWPAELPIKAVIKQSAVGKKRVYSVKDPVDCGLEVVSPAYRVNGNLLELSYKTKSNGAVAACYCDYESEFTFSDLPDSINQVAFSHSEGSFD